MKQQNNVMIIRKQFQCRNDEVIPMAEKVVKSLEKDLDDFVGMKKKLDWNYLELLKQEIEKTKKIADLSQNKLEQELISKEIYDSMAELRKYLWEVEKGLKVIGEELCMQKFDISSCRKALRRRKVDIVLVAIVNLIEQIEKELPLLESKAFDKTKLDVLKQKKQWLEETKQAQGLIKQQNREAKQIKIQALNALWNKINEVLKAGQELYAINDKDRARNFSGKSILIDMRKGSDA
jgi:hypothetical protein